MNQKTLIRFALTIQNNAPTTINKYICKLSESIIFESKKNTLSALEISQKIKEVYALEFDVEEIKNALKQRGNEDILMLETDKYQLSVKAVDKQKQQDNPIDILNKYINEFLNEFSTSFSVEQIKDLVLKYIYYCFNSTADNLMALIKSDIKNPLKDFSGTKEEIETINDFIRWDNLEKNKFLYSVIAFSYDYCALSAKKDILFSKKMFSGKKFILDTNIIFRMAGINNDERRYVINSFVSKCKEVGIELFYTNTVFDEIYRVIDGNIKHIQYLTKNDEPVSYDLIKDINNYEVNDFYKLYYSWSKKPENHYNDFLSFQQYLYSLIREVIRDLDVINVDDYSMQKGKGEFEQYSRSLKEYKNSKRPYKSVSKESLKTDINNLLHTMYTRKSDSNSIWQTNEFVVSADQILVSWAKNTFVGVPLVVIPSVWLSIILRFTGRASDDDYRSYCLFLSLRQNASDDFSINTVNLLQIISTKTSVRELKERIIQEIITNKTEYNFSEPQDYELNTEKAFDIIVKDIAEKSLKNVEDIKSEYRKSIDDKNKENELAIIEEKRQSAQDQEKYALAIAESISNDKTKKWKIFNIICNYIVVIGILFIAVTFLGYSYNIKYSDVYYT